MSDGFTCTLTALGAQNNKVYDIETIMQRNDRDRSSSIARQWLIEGGKALNLPLPNSQINYFTANCLHIWLRSQAPTGAPPLEPTPQTPVPH